jgi:tRNA dimethylallyltransferase
MGNLEKVIVIVGPTASGKSTLAIEIAKRFHGEVVSVDSRAVYSGFSVTTASVTQEEAQGIPHHLVGIWNVEEEHTVADFRIVGNLAVKNILSQDKLPILAGGTGFYLDALINENSFSEVPPNKKLREELASQSTEKLSAVIRERDPRRAKTLDHRNRARIIRALEIVDKLGNVPEISPQKRRYDALIIGITLPDIELRERIRTRIVDRINGMIEEIQKEGERITQERANLLGFDFILTRKFLAHEFSHDELIQRLIFGDWQYSRRQMRWFKRYEDIEWFEPKAQEKIFLRIMKFLA